MLLQFNTCFSIKRKHKPISEAMPSANDVRKRKLQWKHFSQGLKKNETYRNEAFNIQNMLFQLESHYKIYIETLLKQSRCLDA